MKAQIIEQVEFFSEAELESLELVPEELEAIEAERVPDLDSISFEDIAKDLEAYFEGDVEQAGLEGRSPKGQQSINARAGRNIPGEATDKSPISRNMEINHIAYGDRVCQVQIRRARSIHNSFKNGARSVRVSYQHPSKGVRLGPCRKIQ